MCKLARQGVHTECFDQHLPLPQKPLLGPHEADFRPSCVQIVEQVIKPNSPDLNSVSLFGGAFMDMVSTQVTDCQDMCDVCQYMYSCYGDTYDSFWGITLEMRVLSCDKYLLLCSTLRRTCICAGYIMSLVMYR